MGLKYRIEDSVFIQIHTVFAFGCTCTHHCMSTHVGTINDMIKNGDHKIMFVSHKKPHKYKQLIYNIRKSNRVNKK